MSAQLQGSLARELAGWCRRLTVADDVAERGQMLLADFTACMLGGLDEPVSRSTMRALGPDRGAESTAWIMGTSGHALELDDTHEESSLHAGTVIWPTVLALAPECGASCTDALRAAVVGYDVTSFLGKLAGAKATYEHGFHPTGVYGAVGAAAAAGCLLNLDEDALVSAMGIACSLASGTLAFLADGSWTKPMHAGAAAAHGIRAARLAQEGFHGPESALDGAAGLTWAFAGQRIERDALALPAFGSGIRETSIKLYPCCRYNHGLLDLLRPESVGVLDPSTIERITCTVLSGGFLLVASPAADKVVVSNQVAAQFSAPFGAALMLTRHSATLREYRQASVLGPELRPLMERVECVTSDELDRAYPGKWGAAISITLNDGRQIERSTPFMRGSPHAPLTWDGLQQKMADLIGASLAADVVRYARSFAGPQAPITFPIE
ncbi:MAG: MmgE/PrpD family protein [Gemmatimonadota bacterium]